MFFEALLFALIFVLIDSVYGSTHAVVGNYSELNPSDCGITRLSNRFTDKCFKWHKSPIPSLIEGRNATEGDIPFIVDIWVQKPGWFNVSSECSGSAIADRWVLTAAHCLNISGAGLNPWYYHITFGHADWATESRHRRYSVEATAFYIHPNYKWVNSINRSIYDIALIHLNQSIKTAIALTGDRIATELKSICLPEEGIVNTEDEYAMSAGTHYQHKWPNIWQNTTYWPTQLGYKKIRAGLIPDFELDEEIIHELNSVKNTSLILLTSIDNQTLTCKGDSGGPVWQYQMGRAVIVGVIVFITNVSNTGMCQTAEKSAAYGVRVSLHVNWIKNITHLN